MASKWVPCNQSINQSIHLVNENLLRWHQSEYNENLAAPAIKVSTLQSINQSIHLVNENLAAPAVDGIKVSTLQVNQSINPFSECASKSVPCNQSISIHLVNAINQSINPFSFFHIVHIYMLIFTLNGWNEFILALLCFKKCLPQISPKKTTKTKGQKTKKEPT